MFIENRIIDTFIEINKDSRKKFIFTIKTNRLSNNIINLYVQKKVPYGEENELIITQELIDNKDELSDKIINIYYKKREELENKIREIFKNKKEIDFSQYYNDKSLLKIIIENESKIKKNLIRQLNEQLEEKYKLLENCNEIYGIRIQSDINVAIKNNELIEIIPYEVEEKIVYVNSVRYELTPKRTTTNSDFTLRNISVDIKGSKFEIRQEFLSNKMIMCFDKNSVNEEKKKLLKSLRTLINKEEGITI